MERINKIMPYVFPLIVFLVCVLYYFVNPSIDSFPVQCVWHLLTGTSCPSCGTQRALHALMHGHFAQAFTYNYFFVISVPYFIMVVLVTWYNFNHVFDRIRKIVFHRITLVVYIVLYFLWWILRNLFNI